MLRAVASALCFARRAWQPVLLHDSAVSGKAHKRLCFLGSARLSVHSTQCSNFVLATLAVCSHIQCARCTDPPCRLQSLTSKLSDVAVMAACFDFQAVEKDPTTEAWAAHEVFVDTFLHLVSLMHAVALATLRDDYDMSNLMVRGYITLALKLASIQ